MNGSRRRNHSVHRAVQTIGSGRRAAFVLQPLECRLLLSGTYPLSSIPVLNSLPGAAAQLFLDFDGAPARSWVGYSVTATPAYDLDGDLTTFTDTELANIQEIWARVAEKFSPFNINVTTVDPGTYANRVALAAIMGGDGAWAGGGYVGMSTIGSFVNPYPNTVYAFNYGTPLNIAETVAHEAGHAFGLQHQSVYSGTTLVNQYNYGNSIKAPIMGYSDNAARGLWWYGTSSSSTTMQDDLAVIAGASNAFGYRPQDHGQDVAHADPLAVASTALSGSGIIEQMTDADYFSFTTPAGQVTLNVDVAQYGAMLHARLEIHDAADNVLATAANAGTLGQTITTNLAAGTYYLVVKSYGEYGDLGQYTVTGTIPAGTGNPAPVANAGGPYTVTEGGSIALNGAASTGSNLTYAWDLNGNGIFGETGAAATNGDETGATPTFQPGSLHGSATVSLRVTDDSAQTSTATATINITNIAPTPTISLAPTSSPEGSNIILSGSAADPGPGDTFTYAWSVTKNGSAYTSGTGGAWSFIPTDNGTYVVTLAVTDRDGGVGTTTKTITVTNVAPTVSILGAPASGPEGTAINLTSTVSDPGTLDTLTYAWSVTKNGSAYASGTSSNFSFTPNDNGTYVVSLAVTDKDGGVGTAVNQTITVTNVAPTAAIMGAPASSPEGTAINLTGSVTDPGTLDTFTYAWSVTKNGSAYASGTNPIFSFTPNDNGTYVVSLVVTDKDGGVGTAGNQTITVTNVAPTGSIAGAPVSGPEGTAINLTSSVSDPGTVDTFTYAWSVTKNGAAFASGTSSTFSFTPNDNGTYVVNLTVTDDDGAVGTASSKTIAVTNVAPTATINGAPASSPEGTTVTLTSGVTDPGTLDTFTYAWSVTKNGAAYASGTSSTFSFTPNDNGTYVVSLAVTDKDGGVGTAVNQTITVTNVAPTASINGAPASSPEGSAINLTSAVTDPGTLDTFTYAWSVTKNGSAYANGTNSTFSFTPNDNGTYAVNLTVTDKGGGVGTASSKSVTVTNVAPTAAITGAPASSPEGTAINLGAAVTDPGSLDTFTYAWSVTKNGTIYTSGAGSSFAFTPNDNGAYVVSLIVTDKDGASGSDSRSITVTNVAPTVAIAGTPASSPEGTQIHLTSSVTDPGTVDTFTYAWSVTKNGAAYSSGTAADLSFTPNDNGTYVVSLTVTDDDGGAGFAANKTITVANVAPTPSIGGAPVSSPEGSVINLSAAANDPGSLDTITYAWSVTRNGAAYSSGSGVNFSLTPNDNGTFVVTLTATDKDGGVGTTSATINVTNLPPMAIMSGAPANGVEGTAINLTGSATDPGSANTFTYAWNVTRGGSAFASGSGASFSFTPARKGTYTVTLTVTDDGGATGTATATISVSNVAPNAKINVISSGSTVALASSVTDPGPADSFSYAWSVTKNGNAFGNATTSSFSFTPDGPGTYQTTLSVTDLDGDVSTATQTIAVNDYDPVISGTAADEQYYLRLDSTGANVELYAGTSANAPLLFSSAAADLHSLTLNSGDGNDQLIVDLANGNPIPAAGLFFSATTGSLQVIGAGAGAASYAPNSTTSGSGTLTVGSTPISFSGVQSIAISALTSLSLVTTNSGDTILIDSPSAGVSRITGTSDAATIASLQYSQIGNLLLNLGTGTDNVAFQNVTTNLQIIRGADLSISAGGTSLLTLAGSATLTSLTLNDSSRLTFPAAGTSVLRTKGLSIGAGATLDLNDNTLILQSTAEKSAADLDAVQALLASGRNFGAWNGRGIISSQAASDTRRIRGLAAILDKKDDGTPLYTTFGGQSVDADCILVKYTWNGDMNLDGVINFDDYARINSGFLSGSADSGYRNGDLNYDGKINFDDYFMINTAMLSESISPLLTQPQAAVAAPVQRRPETRPRIVEEKPRKQHRISSKRLSVRARYRR